MTKLADGKLRPDIHRQPEPPPGLDNFERRFMPPDGPRRLDTIDRAFLRALLRYVRRIEAGVMSNTDPLRQGEGVQARARIEGQNRCLKPPL